MILVAAGLLVALAVFYFLRSRGEKKPTDANASPALDALVVDAIERELAQSVLDGATDRERANLKKTLLGTDADVDMVSKLERALRSVDLEFIRLAQEADAELNVTVAYENGKTMKTTRRITMQDMPRTVRENFEKNAITRAFQSWQPPWQR